MISDLTNLNGWSVGDCATYYLSLGLTILPCKPGAKLPDTKHGYKSALTITSVPADERTVVMGKVRDFFNETQSNLAIVTGTVVDVLDVDVKNGKPGKFYLRKLETAGLLDGAVAIATTPSGGFHFYFPANDLRSRALADHGLDLKARGGYVLAAPSSVWQLDDSGEMSVGRYEWIWSRSIEHGSPIDWDACLTVLGITKPAPRTSAPSGVPLTDTVDHLARWLITQTNNRNNALFWAAQRAVEEGATTPDQLKPLVDASLALSTPGENREEELWKTARSALSPA